LPFVAVSILISFLRCSTRQPEASPNIILISIDTLRADYVTPEHMPFLCRFSGRNCLVHTNAHSNSTWTKPSHVTMLTGLLQSEHGVEYHESSIPPSLTMVQEKLRGAGYKTAAFVGSGYVSKEWGFDRGFDIFWQLPDEPELTEQSKETFAWKFDRNLLSFDEAEKFLANKHEQPIFLFVHTYYVHHYWLGMFPQSKNIFDQYQELWQDEKLADLKPPGVGKFMCYATPEERRTLYAKAVSDFDGRLHQFLTFMERSPIFSNTKIIITSDHGEGLGDIHESYTSTMHAGPPYSDQINVPLIVYGLGRGKTDQLVGLDDIPGTILQLAGIEENPAKSLFKKKELLISEYISHMKENSSRSAAILTDKEKRLLTLGGSIQLFQDPNDSTDLIRLGREEFAKKEISKYLENQLKALGYLQ